MTGLPSSLLQHTLWEEEKNPIWLGTSLVLQRNLARYKFPPKLSEKEMHSAGQLLVETLQNKSAHYYPAETLSSLDKELVFEHFLCLESFQNAGKGQGFILDDTGRSLILINIKNHLQIGLFDISKDVIPAWTELANLETELGKKIEYAFSPRFGYLTSDSLLCGTALQAFFYLHVPALHHTGQLHEMISKQKDENILPMSLEGNINDLIGDILILKNHYTLGVTEENILHSLQTMTLKLAAAEKTVRSHLKEEGNPEIKDLVSRAYGLLIHSYQLQTKEALGALSLLKLGLDLGWITGITNQTINTLFFQCRHAHLAHILQQKTFDIPDLPHKRAEFIHKSLQGIVLNE